MEKFGKDEYVSQEILDSGFTQIPKHKVTSQGTIFALGVSEMKQSFSGKDSIKAAQFDRNMIKPSTSAFTSDISHIKIKEAAQCPQNKTKNCGVTQSKSYPTIITSDGYTNSVRFGLITHKNIKDPFLNNSLEAKIRKSDPTKYLQMKDVQGSISR
jgi:hypothetical protein